jgi:hypothetical protein
VTDPTSSRIRVMIGALGAVASTMMLNTLESVLGLPAASLAVAFSACGPSPVPLWGKLQVPLVATTLPISVVPS